LEAQRSFAAHFFAGWVPRPESIDRLLHIDVSFSGSNRFIQQVGHMNTPITISDKNKPACENHLTIGALIFPRMDQIGFTGPFEVLSRIPVLACYVLACLVSR
jgi:hypothetical protein